MNDYEEEMLDEDLLDEQMRRRAATRRIVVTLLAIILLIAIVAISVFAYVNQKKTDGKIKDSANEYNEKLLPLYKERADIEQRLRELEKSELKAGENLGSVVFLCTEPGQWILSEIKPYFDEYGCVGTIAVSTDAFPGDDGCLSADELKDLIAHGWSVCLSVMSVDEVDSLNSRLSEIGIEHPSTVYIPDPAVTDIEQYASRRIGNVITHSQCENGVVWNIFAKGSCESGTITLLENAVNHSEGIAFTMGKEQPRETYTDETIISMCQTVGKYVDAGSIKITDPSDARKRYDESVSLYSKEEQAQLKEKNDLENRLIQIEEEIMQYTTANTGW